MLPLAATFARAQRAAAQALHDVVLPKLARDSREIDGRLEELEREEAR